MKIKGLIFDFGFTLFFFRDVSMDKYMNCYKQGLNKSLEKLKDLNILTEDALKDDFKKTFNKKKAKYFKESIKTKQEYNTSLIFKETLEKHDLKDLDSQIFDELANLYHSFEGDEWIPFEHTKQTLEKLKYVKKIKLAVLSNHSHHATIENLLTKHDLRKYFDAVVTSAEYGKRKPDPSIIFYTIKKMGLKSPDDCMICGDEYADISGGNRAGLKAILCHRTFKFPFEKEIINLEHIKINNISEIINLID
ncbi:MAG: HAD family hydrolase [Promethearchaeota archaeon]|nr:MAG: HAD family hydrolase [Candidatus Lokiarchaeota archaeon]